MTPSISVCFAEDEPLMRNYIKNNLSIIHPDFYIKDVASNGLEALNLIRENSYDLFITDVKMPGATGLEVLKTIRSEGYDIPAILLTGYNDFQYAKEAISLGVQEYVLKPLDDSEMRDVLEKLKEKIVEKRNTIKIPENTSADEITKLISKKFLTSAPEDSTLAKKAVDFISSHFKENITQGDVAAAIGVSPSYLSGIFHEETGESYSKFITRLRMTKAALLLKSNPNMTIREISEEVGYFSEKHFMSVFKSFYGTTPNEYRKQ